MEKKKKIQLVMGIAAVFLCGIAYLVLGPGGIGSGSDAGSETEFVAGAKAETVGTVQTETVQKTDNVTGTQVTQSAAVSGNTIYVYITGDKVIVKDSDGTAGDALVTKVDDGRVDINTAGAEELKAIPGIGDAKASAIVAYRTEHGRFKKIEDLMQITGIKQGIFNRIKDHIRV